MAVSSKPPANGFVRNARRIYNPIGFTKGYNFVLFFIFAGALMGFVLARFMYIDYDNVFCKPGPSSGNHAAPGECFFYNSSNVRKAGIIMHLATVLPACFLVVFQFVPAIRHKFLIVHRINGYIIILLALLSVAGAIMIARHAFGGTLTTQLGIGILSIAFVFSLVWAYISIKRLRIDRHRAWMLRAWFYSCSIITLRIIMIISALILTRIGGYELAKRCDVIDSIYNSQNATLAQYPACQSFYSGENPDQSVIVPVRMSSRPEEITAALGIGFDMALWLAMILHAVGVEIYLQCTPAETKRLRKVSMQRRIEAGMQGTEETETETDGEQAMATAKK